MITEAQDPARRLYVILGVGQADVPELLRLEENLQLGRAFDCHGPREGRGREDRDAGSRPLSPTRRAWRR